jgi:integrase
MASISESASGLKRLMFTDGQGRRRTLHLGRVNKRVCEKYRTCIESMLASKAARVSLDIETAKWVSELAPTDRQRLVAVGLIEAESIAADVSLGGFIDRYLEGRVDVKGTTKVILGHTRRCLFDHFDSARSIQSFTPADADSFRIYLKMEGLAENTIRRRIGIARQFFKAAIREKIITSNPFAEIPASIIANEKRMYFITREEAEAVLNACPDAQWRLLFALARYGGLRTPSESLHLKFSDVDWDQKSIRITSPKTERHPGKGERVIPLFPELQPYLRVVQESAPKGTNHFITRYRQQTQNLGTQLGRIIRKAGLKPWPKLWQNLRSTRETELTDQGFPMHVVCKWIGNSQPVALRHYLQVTDQHFERAIETTQNPTQQPLESAGNRASSLRRLPPKTLKTLGNQRDLVGVTGFEPVTSSV